MSDTGASARQQRRKETALLARLRSECASVQARWVRISANDTPVLAGLILAAWEQPGCGLIEYRGMTFPVRRGDDWARVVLDPKTRKPLFSTNGGWLV